MKNQPPPTRDGGDYVINQDHLRRSGIFIPLWLIATAINIVTALIIWYIYQIEPTDKLQMQIDNATVIVDTTTTSRDNGIKAAKRISKNTATTSKQILKKLPNEKYIPALDTSVDYMFRYITDPSN